METSHKSILLVCEDATMLEVRQMLLERFGYRVWSSKTIDQAYRIAQRQCPDMVLLENGYPHEDAEQFGEQMKQACPQIIAVVLTPYFGVRNSSNSVIDRYIARDEAPDTLLAQIGEILDQPPTSEARTASLRPY